MSVGRRSGATGEGWGAPVGGSVIGYHIAVTCPTCGAAVHPVTEGKVIHNAHGAGTETRAIMVCTECKPRREYVLEVFLGYLRPGERPRVVETSQTGMAYDARRMAHLAIVKEMAEA